MEWAVVRKRTAYSPIDADAQFVSVYCDGRDGDSNHERWLVATFYPDAEESADGEPVWMEVVGQYWRTGGEVVHIAGRAATRLVGDRPISHEEWKTDGAVFDHGDSRTRYNLTCRTCGLALVIKAPELRGRVLSPLVAIGAREVSLTGIRYMLRA